ncbi:MAG: hypothetical protein ACJAXI_001690 [Crocinitomicaceae bacterium]|jgi:hypothetical protein
MKGIITLICGAIFMAVSFNGNAQKDMVGYTLDADEQIIGCKVVVLKKNGEIGKVESIIGSKLNLRIHRDNAYKVTINEEKVYYLQYQNQTGFAEVDGIKITTHNKPASRAISSSEAARLDAGIKYRVQIGAFTNEISIQPLKQLGQLYTEEINGGITRYMIGSFMSQEDATKAEAEIKEMGYQNAFTVICNNGKRISFQEATAIIEKPSSLTSN